MTSPRKNQMLVILVVVLLLTNVGMLYYLVKDYKEDKKSRSEKQVDWVKKELKLDDQQMKQYLSLRARRDSAIQPINDQMRAYKLQIIEYLQQPATAETDSLAANAAAIISNYQKGIELAYYQHFRRMRSMCRPDQLPLFDSLLIRMVNRNTNKPEVKPPAK